jgi:hypothetical protein
MRGVEAGKSGSKVRFLIGYFPALESKNPGGEAGAIPPGLLSAGHKPASGSLWGRSWAGLRIGKSQK